MSIRRFIGRLKTKDVSSSDQRNRSKQPAVDTEEVDLSNPTMWTQVFDNQFHICKNVAENSFGGFCNFRGSWKGPINAYRICSHIPVVKQIIDNTGWQRFFTIDTEKSSKKITESLVERWWDTTHTFHLPCGELGFTPLDWAMLTGISIGIGDQPPCLDEKYPFEIVQSRFFPEITEDDWKSQGIRTSFLKKYFQPSVIEEAKTDNHVATRVARAFFVYFLGEFLFANGASLIRCGWLAALEDLTKVGTFDWGGQAVALLYMSLDACSRQKVKSFNGPWQVLQYWAYEYTHCCVPITVNTGNLANDVQAADKRPRITRWNKSEIDTRRTDQVRYNVSIARYQLEMRTPASIIWQPYLGSSNEAENDVTFANIMSRHRVILQYWNQENRDTHHRRYIRREREDGDRRLHRDYFASNPIYGDSLFRRRFRMRRHLFCRILQATVSFDTYFVKRQDATKTFGLSPHQKITAAIRCLAYGSSTDAIDEYVCIGESTVLKTLRRFCVAIVNVFGPEYMRHPTVNDVERLLAENSARGFPGMLGSIDCMHWPWKNCPAAWHGQYTGHVREPTIVLEAVASYDLWFWHSFFGMPGCNNDLNVLNHSPLFNNILDGCAPPAEFVINNHAYNMGYYLADGIYPPLATIIKTYSAPDTPKKKKFAQMQESARKDVERAFGVLQARFAIVKGPARLWDADSLSYIMKTCIILHNMIVEDEREAGINDYVYDHDSNSSFVVPDRSDPTERAARTARTVQLHDRQIHHALRLDLVEHIWNAYGEDEDDDD